MQDAPDPLVSPEVDLSNFPFMPLEVQRLLRSEFYLTAMEEDARVAAASVNLWASSWHERPAASLPNSDVLLARAAALSLAVWREVKARVMAEWTLCSDGRWYHRVVAEKAMEAWNEKCDYARRKAEFSARQRARIEKRWAQEREENKAEDTARIDPEDTARNTEKIPMKGTGKGTGTGIKEKTISSPAIAVDPPVSRQSAPAEAPAPAEETPADEPPPKEGYTAEFESWWQVYPRKDAKGAAFRAFKSAKRRTSVAKLMDGAAAYAQRAKALEARFIRLPATWLNGDGWNDAGVSVKRQSGGPVFG